jgi:hypothetical protein
MTHLKTPLNYSSLTANAEQGWKRPVTKDKQYNKDTHRYPVDLTITQWTKTRPVVALKLMGVIQISGGKE